MHAMSEAKNNTSVIRYDYNILFMQNLFFFLNHVL